MQIEIVKPFDNVLKIYSDEYKDDRGSFLEGYRLQHLQQYYNIPKFVQSNLSYSKFNVFRGLHYQLKPHAQAKLVRCINGSLIDIILDIRHDSDTFGQHAKVLLNTHDVSIYIPEGFAHGFLAKEHNTILYYEVSEYYMKNYDRAINVFDPELKIEINNPIMSNKDRTAPYLKVADNF